MAFSQQPTVLTAMVQRPFKCFKTSERFASDSNILSFDYRAGWNMLDFAGPPAGKLDRVLNLNIFTAGSFNTLIGSNEVLRMVGGTKNSDTGSLSKSIDLSAFNGQSIRISFDAFVPQNFTGPRVLSTRQRNVERAAPATVPNHRRLR